MAEGFDVHKLTDDKKVVLGTLQDKCRATVLQVAGIDRGDDLREKLDLPQTLIDFLTKQFGSSDFFINKDDVTAEDIASETYKAVCVLNNQSVILKCIPNSTMTEENAEKVTTWRNNNLKGIQRCLVSFKEGQKELFILAGGLQGLNEVIKYLKISDIKSDEMSIWCLSKKIAEVLKGLQTKDMRYDNLDASKICIDENGDVVLCNQIRYITENENNDPFAMSGSGSDAIYTPPEVISGEEATIKSDVWKIGCVLYEVAMQKPAYSVKGADIFESLNEVVEGNKPESLSSNFSESLKDTIWACLDVSVSERPDLESLIAKADEKLNGNFCDLKNFPNRKS